MSTQPVIPLAAADLAIAAGLVLLAGVVSLAFRLDLEKRLAVAAARTVVQLLLIGYVLKWVFGAHSVWLLGLVALAMIAMAARESVRRPERTFAGVSGQAFVVLVISGLLTTCTVTAAIVRPEPWWEPRYFIPLLGMTLGNSLTGISLCLDHLLETLAMRQDEVETELALGATRWEAARGPLREAVRRGMVPTINAMTVVGIVSLPGMMTGQILAGSDPLQAVKYQIVVMFMIAAAVSLGCILTALLVFRHLFNDRHQLLRGLIRKRE